MTIEAVTLAAFAIVFFGNVLTDHNAERELFHWNMHKALDSNGVTVIYDETTVAESMKFLKFAVHGGIPFSYVNASKTLAHMNRDDFAKQIIVFCKYYNISSIIRNFAAKKIMVLPYIWIFVTQEDLGPIFTDDTLGSVMTVSNMTNKVTLYSKGCRGLNVTRFPEVGLEKLISFESLLRDLKPLQGCTLGVVVMNHKPVSWYDGEKSSGVDVDVVRVLAEATGQKISFVKSKDNTFGLPTANGWNGNLGVLERNEQDLAVPFFMLVRERSRVFSTSHRVHFCQWVGFIKTEQRFSATGVFKPFTLEIWMIIASTSAGLAICYTLSSRLQLYSWKQTKLVEIFLYLLDKGFHAWTAFLQQESRPTGDFTSGRMLLLTISTTSLIILTAYSSVLFAVLSSIELDIPFRSMHELIENGQFKPVFQSTGSAMGVINDSRHKSFRDLYQQFLEPCGSYCLPATHREAMNLVDSPEKVVYFATKRIALKEAAENCKYVIAIDNIAHVTFHIHWRAGFVHMRFIDPYIMKIRENGIISRIYQGAIKPAKICNYFNMELGIEIMYFPFVIHGFGICVSLAFLLVEILLYCTTNEHAMKALP